MTPGDVVMVHGSLRRRGFVIGATRAVIFPAAETVEAVTEWRKEKGV